MSSISPFFELRYEPDREVAMYRAKGSEMISDHFFVTQSFFVRL